MPALDMLTNLIRADDAAPPMEAVARVVAASTDPVLWSGPGHLAATVQSQYNLAALMVLAFLALIGLTGLALRWRAIRGLTVVPSGGSAGVTFLLICAIASAGFGFMGKTTGDEWARTAYVITPTRIVVLEGPDGRKDIPATAIAQVRQEKGRVTIAPTRGNPIVIEAEDIQGLAAAASRLVDTAGRGSGALRDTLG